MLPMEKNFGKKQEMHSEKKEVKNDFWEYLGRRWGRRWKIMDEQKNKIIRKKREENDR
jgi:hypothetical protein